MSEEWEGYNDQVLIEGIVDITAHSCVVEPSLSLCLCCQGDGLRRKFAENQERMRKLEEDVGRGQEREKRLQDQRDGLQNREELMDLQVSWWVGHLRKD